MNLDRLGVAACRHMLSIQRPQQDTVGKKCRERQVSAMSTKTKDLLLSLVILFLFQMLL